MRYINLRFTYLLTYLLNLPYCPRQSCDIFRRVTMSGGELAAGPRTFPGSEPGSRRGFEERSGADWRGNDECSGVDRAMRRSRRRRPHACHRRSDLLAGRGCGGLDWN